MDLLYDLKRRESSRIAIVGVGLWGSRFVGDLESKSIPGVRSIGCCSYSEEFSNMEIGTKIILGGNSFDLSIDSVSPYEIELATISSEGEIMSFIDGDISLVFMVVSLSDIQGAIASSVLASMIMSTGVTVVALSYLDEAMFRTNSFLPIESIQDALKLYGTVDSMQSIFSRGRVEYIVSTIEIVASMASSSGLIDIGFADIISVLKDGGALLIEKGIFDIDSLRRDPRGEVSNHPILSREIRGGANRVLVNIKTGDQDLDGKTFKRVLDSIMVYFEKPEIFMWSLSYDKTLKSSVSIDLIVAELKDDYIVKMFDICIE